MGIPNKQDVRFMLSHIFVEVQKQKKHKSLEKQMQEKTECLLDPPYDQIREGLIPH